MKYNLNVSLLGLNNKPALDQENNQIIVKDLCSNALIAQKQGVEEDGKKKLEKFNLALRLSQSKEEIDLTAEEVVTIKESVGMFNGPLPYGRVCEILDK